MAKFHVNNSGEPGKCAAEHGRCPFGGDAQHYESSEVARQAFELSMAGSQVPEASKKTSKVVRTDAVEAVLRDEWYSDDYGGLDYKEVVFDKEDILRKWTDFYKQNARVSKTTMEGVSEAAHGSMLNEKKVWEAAGRIEPAKSYEKGVPIRLLPVGVEVEVNDYRRGVLYKTVGTPVDNGDGHVVGKYRDIANEWDYVEPNTTFNLGPVPSNKSVSPRWKAANAKAAEIAKQRAQYQQDLVDAAEMKKQLSASKRRKNASAKKFNEGD
jgi:hypothetical protein